MHYLAKQAARTLALPSGVRPRLPARFDAAPFEPVTFEPVTVEQMVSQPEAAAPAPPPEMPRTVIVENVLRREAERVQTIVERVMPRTGPVRMHEEIVETRIVPRIEPAQTQERPRAVEPKLEQPQPPRNAREREEPPQPRTISDERIVRMIERTETKAVRTAEGVQSAAVASTVAGASVAPLHTAVPPQKPPVQTRAAERAPRQHARADDAPPAIHVTIGRVDVRAVMTSEAPAKPAPAAMQPSLSLDDYLKQREGRSR